MDGISTVGGVVGFAVQVATSAKQIYDFINSVKDSPKEFKVLAQELETIHRILTSWAKQAESTPNEHVEDAIEICRVYLIELDQLVAKYRSHDGSGRREQMTRALKGALGKKKVQEIMAKLESTKSTLQLAIAGALHSKFGALHSSVQLIYQELRTSTSPSTSLSSNQIPAILQQPRYRQIELESQTPKADGIEQDVESIFEQLARNTGEISDLIRTSQQQTISTYCSNPIQEAISSLVDVEMRKQMAKVGDKIENAVKRECRKRFLPLDCVEDGCHDRLDMNGISHVTREYGYSFHGHKQTPGSSRNRSGLNAMNIQRNKKAKPPLPIGKLNYNTKSPLVRSKTKWIRRHKTPFGIFIFRCDVRVISDGIHNSYSVGYFFTFIPNSQFSLAISAYSIRVAQKEWNKIPTFNLQQFNIIPDDSAIFKLIVNGGDTGELRELLISGKASPFDVSENGFTPLHLAAYYGNFEFCKILINYGSKVNADLGFHSPLTTLFFLGKTSKLKIKTLRLLLANGADPFQVDHNGATPLLMVAFKEPKYTCLSLELLQIFGQYKGLNEPITCEELGMQNCNYDPAPWYSLNLFMRLSERIATPNYLDELRYLGVNFAQGSENYSLNDLLLSSLHPFESRKLKEALLRKSIELCPFTHHVVKQEHIDASIYFYTPTSRSYEAGLFEPWLGALICSGENIEKFLEDDLKIMESYEIHVWRCECYMLFLGAQQTESGARQFCTCRELYFKGLLQFYEFDRGTGKWVPREDAELNQEKVMYKWFWPKPKVFMTQDQETEYERHRPIFENLANSTDDNGKGSKSIPHWSIFKKRYWVRWIYENYRDAENQRVKDSLARASYGELANENNQLEEDPFGSALRSEWGEFVFEIDKPKIAFLLLAWFLFQQTLVVEKFVNQALSIQRPRENFPISHKSSEESETNDFADETGAERTVGGSVSSNEPQANSQSNSGEMKWSKRMWFRKLRKRSKAA